MSRALQYNPLMEAAQLTAVHNEARTSPVHLSFGTVAAREAFSTRLEDGLCTPLPASTATMTDGATIVFLALSTEAA